MILSVEPLPDIYCRAFQTKFPRPLGRMETPPQVASLLSFDCNPPLTSSDSIRKAIRDMLRRGGFKPTGRSKPASEYLRKAVEINRLPPINIAVDAGNAVSLHSGIPISVVDAGLLVPPLRLAIAPADAAYVFNASGQSLDLHGLLCLFDQEGPCGNAVKDSHRTKTSDDCTRTLSILWGAESLADHVDKSADWYRQLLLPCGAEIESVETG